MTRYICVAVISLLALSCARFEEDAMPQQQLMQMRLAACVDTEEALTKTFLDGQPVVSVRNTYWLPDDAIGVTGNRNVAKFENICEDTTSVAFFDGQYESLDTYYAFYPYSEDASYSHQDTTIILNIPTVQKYQKNTFATDVVPMVAKFQLGDSLYFKNICGGFVVKMTGTDKITNLRLIAVKGDGSEAKISGRFKVDPKSSTYDMTYMDDAATSISIDCGDGVQLDPTTPTAFHFILPPATYNGVKLAITSSEGERMVKSTSKPLAIRRSNITYASVFEFKNTVEEVDLSYYGNSNCYIVTDLGAYSFDATIIGNGAFGMLEDAALHTDDYHISPASAELVWQDREDVVSNVRLDNGRVYFLTDGVEGNALIAVKNASGEILWSWHIWCTDQPKEQVYSNNAGVMLDRNLGAISASPGDMGAAGLLYQWGRKDPFLGVSSRGNNNLPAWPSPVKSDSSNGQIEYAVKNPNVFITNNSSNGDWYYTGSSSTDDTRWQPKKTIYDPCPIGYRVPEGGSSGVWSTAGFADSSYDSVNGGITFNIISPSTTWYAATGLLNYSSGNLSNVDNGYYWSVTPKGRDAYNLDFYNSGVVRPEEYDNRAYGFSVRCQKDELMHSVLVTLREIVDVRETSAYANAIVTVQGDVEVKESGYVIGTEPSVSVENGRIVYSADKIGDISMAINGLSPMTKYYVRAFAVTVDGKVYYSSDVMYFITPNGSGVIDLNIKGTANCYVVYPVKATYCYDLVKGNSTESVGTVASAEVLWETYNTIEDVLPGTVVTSVSIDANHVVFEIPDDAKPGNALIAVKDASGVILWSWHIWVTDFDPEATAQTYISGAVMMDRNLGALRSTPGDPSVYGMFYQWGRKDPLLGSYDGNNFISTSPADVRKYTDLEENRNVDYTTQNPSTVVKSLNNDAASWSWSKTIYDPCPVGWRVPDGHLGVWRDISAHIKADAGYYIEEPYSTPVAYYPGTGYTEGDADLSDVGTITFSWSSTIYDDNESYALYLYNNNRGQYSRYNWYEHTVRCTKIDTSGTPGSGDDYIVDDEYEW